MHAYVQRFTDRCIRAGIVRSEDAAWFTYGVERRLSTLFVAIPFFALAVILTNLLSALFFYAGFFLLRRMTNGYHAKTVTGCLVTSVIAEVMLCVAIYPFLNIWVMLPLCGICAVLIFCLAPYLHKNLPLDKAQIAYCRKHARIRSIIIFAAVAVSALMKLTDIARGLTLGIAMASGMLCVPYIKRKVIEKWQITLKS